jgi:hypothetical protein
MVHDQHEDQAYHHGARRQSKRYRLNANVRIVSPVQADGVTLNMSAGGVRVVLTEDLPYDEDCLIEVWVTPRRCHVERARVVWSQRYVDGFVLGLKFLEDESPGDDKPQA